MMCKIVIEEVSKHAVTLTCAKTDVKLIVKLFHPTTELYI